MLNRNLLLALAVAGLCVVAGDKMSMAGSPLAGLSRPVSFAVADKKEMEKEDADGEKDAEKDDEKGEKKWKKDIEESVPMNMIPQAVLDAVKKEVPNGTITEAELEVKKGHIMYGFDVTDGAMKYDINITVDGKFFSKVVDDDKDDEKDEKAEKKLVEKK